MLPVRGLIDFFPLTYIDGRPAPSANKTVLERPSVTSATLTPFGPLAMAPNTSLVPNEGKPAAINAAFRTALIEP